MNVFKRSSRAVLTAAASIGLVVGGAASASAANDGGEACTSWSYGQVCSNIRQYSGNGQQWVWGSFKQSAGTASPDVYSMTMTVEFCKGTSRSITCQVPANGRSQTWNITSDYNNECPTIWRGGPSDSGACDMPGLSFDGAVGTYYYSITTVYVKRYSTSATSVMWAVSPVQLDRA